MNGNEVFDEQLGKAVLKMIIIMICATIAVLLR
jgi:hypothetical protein